MGTTTIGPVVQRECGFCQGQGTRLDSRDDTIVTCDLCNGAGRIDVSVDPFAALERAMEHVMAIRTSQKLWRTEAFKPKPGTPAYHVDAVEDNLRALFQQLVVMLPEEYERSEVGP